MDPWVPVHVHGRGWVWVWMWVWLWPRGCFCVFVQGDVWGAWRECASWLRMDVLLSPSSCSPQDMEAATPKPSRVVVSVQTDPIHCSQATVQTEPRDSQAQTQAPTTVLPHRPMVRRRQVSAEAQTSVHTEADIAPRGSTQPSAINTAMGQAIYAAVHTDAGAQAHSFSQIFTGAQPPAADAARQQPRQTLAPAHSAATATSAQTQASPIVSGSPQSMKPPNWRCAYCNRLNWYFKFQCHNPKCKRRRPSGPEPTSGPAKPVQGDVQVHDAAQAHLSAPAQTSVQLGQGARQRARQQGAAPRLGPGSSHAAPPHAQTPGAHQQHRPDQRPPPPPPYHSTLAQQPSQQPPPTHVHAMPGPPYTQSQGTPVSTEPQAQPHAQESAIYTHTPLRTPPSPQAPAPTLPDTIAKVPSVTLTETSAEAPAVSLTETSAEAPSVTLTEISAEAPAVTLPHTIAEAPAVTLPHTIAEAPAVTLPHTIAEAPAVTLPHTIAEAPAMTLPHTIAEAPAVTLPHTIAEAPAVTLPHTIAEAPAPTLPHTIAEAPAVTLPHTIAEAPAVTLPHTIAEAPAMTLAHTIAEAPAMTLPHTIAEAPAVTLPHTIAEAPAVTLPHTIAEAPAMTLAHTIAEAPAVTLPHTIAEAPAPTLPHTTAEAPAITLTEIVAQGQDYPQLVQHPQAQDSAQSDDIARAQGISHVEPDGVQAEAIAQGSDSPQAQHDAQPMDGVVEGPPLPIPAEPSVPAHSPAAAGDVAGVSTGRGKSVRMDPPVRQHKKQRCRTQSVMTTQGGVAVRTCPRLLTPANPGGPSLSHHKVRVLAVGCFPLSWDQEHGPKDAGSEWQQSVRSCRRVEGTEMPNDCDTRAESTRAALYEGAASPCHFPGGSVCSTRTEPHFPFIRTA